VPEGGHEVNRADCARASDLDLLQRVRQHDGRAGRELLARHSRAVARLLDAPGDDVGRSGGTMLDLARQRDLGVPFRAAWLAHLTQGRLPDETASDHVAWRAFLNLPHTWRLAIWHHQVEGAPVGRTATHLGTSRIEAERILRSAHTAVMRHVATAHAADHRAPHCAAFVESFRHDPPASLTRGDRHVLRSHGRHCDDCMPFIRDLFHVEHGLRRILAEPVLGPATERYLARRPATRAVPAERAQRPLSRRRASSLIAGLVGAGLAASLTWMAVAEAQPAAPHPAAQVTVP